MLADDVKARVAEGSDTPGRSCPLDYRYDPRALGAGEPVLESETVYVAGGVYGNAWALERLVAMARDERVVAPVVLNGDFHWFDAEPTWFARVDDLACAQHALRGNVETELGPERGEDGCGCAYPDFVDDLTVARSNAIIARLRRTASAARARRLASLPMHALLAIGGHRVAAVHGDAWSLAGWGFATESLLEPRARAAAAEAFAAARVDVFACSHTCLPLLRRVGDRALVINNGAAGMPNFHHTRFGVATRISVHPSPHPVLYGARIGRLRVDAVAVPYDAAAFRAAFLAAWPEGSPAHASYLDRIERGPRYQVAQAVAA